MNIKKKISGIVLLTMVILIGGGFNYYSILSDIRQVPGAVYTLNLQKAESPTVRLDNINSKNRSSTLRSKQQKTSVPRAAVTSLQKEVRSEAIVYISGNILSGSTNYTYRKKSRDTKSTYQDGGFGSTSILAYGNNRGRANGSEQPIQTFGAAAITEPGATSPFAVPRNPYATPPTNGEGIIMVDPMTDPLVTNRIPVGEGGWILLLLALGYVVWKKK